MNEIVITEEMLASLRVRVAEFMTEKRYRHTLGVERECEKLGKLLLPDKINKLRAAALLHDITKVLSLEKQLQYCENFGIIHRNSDLLSPKIFHAKTASELVKRDYPEFADEEVVSGIRWHTTGHCDMTLFEAIVYLADYIEDTRTFEDCVKLRRFFYDGIAASKDQRDIIKVFYRTMILSFDMTISGLISENAPIDTDTVGARNYYIGLYKENYNG